MGDQLIFMLVGLGLMAVGLYLMFGKKGGQQSGQILVEATIVDKVSRREDVDGDHPNCKTTVSTYPVYAYTVNGTKYRAEGNVAITVFSENKYLTGNRETVRVDPSNPQRIHTGAERSAMRGLGAALLFFGLIALYMVFSGGIFY